MPFWLSTYVMSLWFLTRNTFYLKRTLITQYTTDDVQMPYKQPNLLSQNYTDMFILKWTNHFVNNWRATLFVHWCLHKHIFLMKHFNCSSTYQCIPCIKKNILPIVIFNSSLFFMLTWSSFLMKVNFCREEFWDLLYCQDKFLRMQM